MELAVMQPYFFPYIGYFQLIYAADIFVVYDNVKFTKKGWLHRNRLVFNNKVEYFTINLAKDSDHLNVVERKISPIYFEKEMPKILRKIYQYYSKAPYFDEVFPIVDKIFRHKEENLFYYIYNSLVSVVKYLNIDTTIMISSHLPIDHTLKNKWRLFDFAHCLGAKTYINSMGGQELYSKDEFEDNGIKLLFLSPVLDEYKQLSNEFIPGLSIIDVMMYNSVDAIQNYMEHYQLI